MATTVVVFPTPVGVFLATGISWAAPMGLPHARGGVSLVKRLGEEAPESSPRPWGCFLSFFILGEPVDVFPTPVGVFPDGVLADHDPLRLPHARGGVSQISSN